LVGDHDAAGQRQPESEPEPQPEHPCSLLGHVAAAGS
jgi:hypothetical protein